MTFSKQTNCRTDVSADGQGREEKRREEKRGEEKRREEKRREEKRREEKRADNRVSLPVTASVHVTQSI